MWAEPNERIEIPRFFIGLGSPHLFTLIAFSLPRKADSLFPTQETNLSVARDGWLHFRVEVLGSDRSTA